MSNAHNFHNFQILPQIDKILNHESFKGLNKGILAKIARESLSQIRSDFRKFNFTNQDEVLDFILEKYRKFERKSLQNVINLTGIIIHTNLGRTPINPSLWDEAKELVCNYSNLEFDLDANKRSNRYDESAFLLSALFGSQDALVVNNNAAAVFLVLNTFGTGGECVLSRGELVEIGGGFRVPEVMAKSGAKLVEIGTTNKTRLKDYQNAINENTKMLLKIHRSNFEIVGFCEETSLEDIANLGKEKNILTYYDLGGGAALKSPILGNEPVVENLIKTGVDLLSFSGDKLFGSVQAGIILGKKELIAKLRSNQLLRMLRCDKTCLALLNLSLRAYLEKKYDKIAILELLNRSTDELEKIAKKINSQISNIAQIIHTSTFVGGGTTPNHKIPSVALAFSGEAKKIESLFRTKNVIGRIENESFILDLRSLLPSDENKLISVIKEIFSKR